MKIKTEVKFQSEPISNHMPKIIIKRNNAAGYRFRDINIYINEEKVGKIGMKESKEFEVEAGTHHIHTQVNNSESQAKTVTLADNDVYTLDISASNFLRWLIVITIILSIINLFFQDELGLPNYTLFLIYVPAVLASLYYSTIARKKYLILKEV